MQKYKECGGKRKNISVFTSEKQGVPKVRDNDDYLSAFVGMSRTFGTQFTTTSLFHGLKPAVTLIAYLRHA